MDASIVHIVAQQLSFQELKRLYKIIGDDINKKEQKTAPTKIKKKPLISNEESRNLLLEKVFKVKLK